MIIKHLILLLLLCFTLIQQALGLKIQNNWKQGSIWRQFFQQGQKEHQEVLKRPNIIFILVFGGLFIVMLILICVNAHTRRSMTRQTLENDYEYQFQPQHKRRGSVQFSEQDDQENDNSRSNNKKKYKTKMRNSFNNSRQKSKDKQTLQHSIKVQPQGIQQTPSKGKRIQNVELPDTTRNLQQKTEGTRRQSLLRRNSRADRATRQQDNKEQETGHKSLSSAIKYRLQERFSQKSCCFMCCKGFCFQFAFHNPCFSFFCRASSVSPRNIRCFQAYLSCFFQAVAMFIYVDFFLENQQKVKKINWAKKLFTYDHVPYVHVVGTVIVMLLMFLLGLIVVMPNRYKNKVRGSSRKNFRNKVKRVQDWMKIVYGIYYSIMFVIVAGFFIYIYAFGSLYYDSIIERALGLFMTCLVIDWVVIELLVNMFQAFVIGCATCGSKKNCCWRFATFIDCLKGYRNASI